MTDLIRREDAIQSLRERFCGDCKPCAKCDVCDTDTLIRDMMRVPAAKAVELRQGCWEEQEYGTGDSVYVCSECHAEWVLNDGNPTENNMNYCPECGARMDSWREESIYAEEPESND